MPPVSYANSGQDQSLERFIEGVADTGRRGPREALRILFDMVGESPKAEELMEYCFRLALACDALTAPNLDKDRCLAEALWIETAIQPLAESKHGDRHRDRDDAAQDHQLRRHLPIGQRARRGRYEQGNGRFRW